MAVPAPTAAILVIGNEILSGSTQDANIAYIGKRMAAKGIKLAEVRIVRDEEAAIVTALNALRGAYTYVFTTGGIGPTHDDITAESVAKAFGVPCIINAEARDYMTAKYAERGIEMNDGRLRMARMPETATLVMCAETIAPGFRTGNVFTFAGVPRIMQAQLAAVEPVLENGPEILSRVVACNLKEGDIAYPLEDIQKANMDVDIGSYPHMGQTPSLSFIIRGTDAARLEAVAAQVADMVRAAGDAPT